MQIKPVSKIGCWLVREIDFKLKTYRKGHSFRNNTREWINLG